MGLYRRKDSPLWWMSFTVNRKLYRRSTETSDRRQAEKILGKVQTQIVENKWFDVDTARQYTFDELMERYSKEVVTNKAHGTQITNMIQIDNLLSFFSNLTLDRINPQLISRYKAKRIDEGVKLQTVRYELVVMSHAFNIAMREWQWVNSNPLQRIRLPQQDNKVERWLTYQEQDILLSFCEDWVRRIVLFALNTGLRMGEIINLKWKDFDLERKTVTIMETKNNDKKTLPLNEIVIDILRELSSVSNIINMSGYVFTRNGKQLQKQELQYYFNKAVKNSQIAHCRFHDLRHTFATRLAQAGIDLFKISKLLGHRDIKSTQRYAHHYPESLREGVDILISKSKQKEAQFHDIFTLATVPNAN